MRIVHKYIVTRAPDGTTIIQSKRRAGKHGWEPVETATVPPGTEVTQGHLPREVRIEKIFPAESE